MKTILIVPVTAPARDRASVQAFKTKKSLVGKKFKFFKIKLSFMPQQRHPALQREFPALSKHEISEIFLYQGPIFDLLVDPVSG